MNTFARQSISKTFFKACTAAVLLVTCLNMYATDSAVEDMFTELGTESLTQIYSELNTNELLNNSKNDMHAALENGKPQITNDLNAENTDSNSSSWSSINGIHPAIASLGQIDLEVKDIASREATKVALKLAIEALENSKKIAVNQSLTL